MIPGPGGSLVGAGGSEFPVRSLGSLAWAGRGRRTHEPSEDPYLFIV